MAKEDEKLIIITEEGDTPDVVQMMTTKGIRVKPPLEWSEPALRPDGTWQYTLKFKNEYHFRIWKQYMEEKGLL